MIANKADHKVVVPWNFNELSRAALNRALEMGVDRSSISVVHVAAPLSGPDNGLLYAAAEQRKGQKLKERFRKQVENDQRTRGIRFEVVYGYVGREIAQFAEKNRAKLIVMSSRNKKAPSRFLFGSVTEQVSRLAHCQVLRIDEQQANVIEHPQASNYAEPVSV